jgi:TP901 family phage tail tape measure protein
MADNSANFDLILRTKIESLNQDLGRVENKIDKSISSVGASSGRNFAQLFQANLLADLASAGIRTALNKTLDFGSTALNTAKTFQASMVSVKALSGATSEQFTELNNKAKEFGRTTQFTASESANSFEVLTRNGLKVEEIMGGAAEATLDLAAATGSDLTNSADIVTDAMNQFNLSAEQVNDAVNGITGTTVNSKFTIDDYRLAIGQAGGVAGSVGVEFEDFNTVIAATSQNFTSGSDAGTSFKTFLQRLIPQSKEAAALMQDYNLEFFNANGEMKSMAEISKVLTDNLGGLSEEQRNNATSTIFGTDAMRTAAGLIDTTEEKFASLQASIGDTNASEIAEVRLEGLEGAMKILNSTVETLMISFFDLNIGGERLIDWLEIGAEALTEFLRDTNKLVPVLGGLAAVIGTLGGALTAFYAFPLIAGLFAGFSGVVGTITGAITSFVGLIPLLGGVVTFFTTALVPTVVGFFTGLPALIATAIPAILPIILSIVVGLTLIIATIGLVGAAIATAIAIFQNWEQVLTMFEPTVQKVKEVVRELIPVFKEVVDYLIRVFQPIIDRIVSEVLPALIPVIERVLKTFQLMIPFIAPVAKFLIDTIANAVNTVIDVFIGLMRFLEGAFDIIEGIFTGDGTKIKNGFIKVFSGLSQAVGAIFRGVINNIVDTINRGFSLISGVSVAGIDLPAVPRIPRLATGGSFVVPPGFENDKFLLAASSDERVTVEPNNSVNNSYNRTINFGNSNNNPFFNPILI